MKSLITSNHPGRPHLRLAGIIALAVALSASAQKLELPAEPGVALQRSVVVPPGSTYKGKTYAEWSANYWQWYMGLPVQDSDGNPLPAPNYDVRFHQAGEVWFLGAPGTAERIVSIPAGKALFVGLPCAEVSSLEEPPFHGDTEQEQRQGANWFANHIVADSIFCEIDGQPVQHITSFRTSSPQFTFEAPTPWVFGAAGGTGTSVADGYYVLITPLSKGQHVLHTGGRFHFSVAEGDPFDLDFAGDTTFYINVTSDNEATPGVQPPQSHPYGKSYAEWSAEHWKWIYSLPVDQHPLYDTADAATGQPFGHVWFIGGTYAATPDTNGNIEGVATRNITVPAGIALFFPITDVEASVLEGNGTTEAELRASASYLENHAQGMTCSIDGRLVRSLNGNRVQSPLFTIGPLPDNNVFQASGVTAPAGTTTPSISDGVFVMVAPLSVGQHTIHFTGSLVFTAAQDGFDFIFSQDITYNIEVRPAN